MYYTQFCARQKDRIGILRVLAILASCKDDRAYEDPFLHSLIALLIPMNDEFANEDFCTGLFDEFLFAGLTRDNVTRHMLKLLWYVHSRLPVLRLKTLMKALQPTTQHHENVHKLYENLQGRIGNTIQEHPPEQMDIDFDSPLKNVPTPGPHYV
jgi:negative elongation factor B